jgi:uncharacterized protein YbaR (Trm112 family)/SAM-dependent methyltransferase
MRLNFLDFLVCPGCGGPLAAVPFSERESDPNFSHFCRFWCAARAVGAETIDRSACPPCHRRDIIEGILWCGACRSVFPVHESIPEVLPPEIANWDLLHGVLENFPAAIERRPEIAAAAREAEAAAGAPAGSPEKWKYKRAEARLTRRSDLPGGFFNPGLVVPFEPNHPVRSTEKILRFMIPVHHAGFRSGEYILDLGVGYAWTTEWLKKLGTSPVGVDLNRDYLRVGMRRTGGKLPPLLIADVENLPLRREMFHGALFFDAFHHVADRAACLRSCAACLVPGGTLVMAEPGEKHESDPGSVRVMQAYGILEKGITAGELRALAETTEFGEVKKFPYEFGDVEVLMAVKRGRRLYTSRGPNNLFAEIVPDRAEVEMTAGRPERLRVRVRNTGDTLWLRRTRDDVGMVRVGFQLKGPGGAPVDENYLRASLPRDLAPGEAADLAVELPAIARPGDYLVEIDGVAEGLVWFKDISYNPVTIAVRVRG